MTRTAKQLVEDAAVGKEVSAIAETARRQKRPPKPQHASAIPRAAYSITEFCQAHGFSEWTYFCMRSERVWDRPSLRSRSPINFVRVRCRLAQQRAAGDCERRRLVERCIT